MKTKNDTLNAIQTMVNSAVEQAGYDKTRNAVIIARNSNNTYNIKMDGIEYDNVVFYGSGEAQVNEVVKVVIPNNQASQMYVMGKGGVIASDSNPIGSVITFAGSNAPVGYLMCDGSAVSREIYADLFAVIGTTYGVGDGSTTFNLPNWKQDERKLLWTNPNPTVAFSAQTIPLDLSGYDEVEIVGSVSSGDADWTYFNQRCEVIANLVLQAYYGYLNRRIARVRTTGIEFNVGIKYTTYNSTATEDNSRMIPHKIYGIKETTPVIKAAHSVTIQGVDTMSEAEYQDLLERLDVI